MASPAPTFKSSPSISLGVIKTDASNRVKPICSVSHKDLDSVSLETAQKIWDAYLEKMLTRFNEPNPDLNRDLALNLTVRALGQRPMSAVEQQKLLRSYSCSAICYRSHPSATHLPTRQEAKLNRCCAQEDALEELCNAAFDA